MRYFKGVPITEDGTDEPVQYVGVHPVRWHRRPAQPQMGFKPVTEEVAKLQDQRRELRARMHMIRKATSEALRIQDIDTLFNTIADIDRAVSGILETTVEDPLEKDG